MKNSIPSSIYIHIPFCEHLCDYCDFCKLQYFRLWAINYLKSLKNELDSYHIDHEIKTIYVGGGTPTSLEDDLFVELLEIIKPYTDHAIEYTFEANPESLSKYKLEKMHEYGVNRLSIGVETTDDKINKIINRHHTFNDVKSAVKTAREVGFNNINVDLILGLPHTNPELLRKDLDNILSLDVEHISCYSLTVHEHTKFFLDGIKEKEDEYMREQYDIVHQTLNEHGYIHYEVSNWCKPNYHSKHNSTYWQNEKYYGIGLGASGYINNYRYTNTRNLNKYLNNDTDIEFEEVSLLDELRYEIILSLRTIFGLDLEKGKEKYYYDLLKNREIDIKKNIDLGFLKLENNHLIPTYEGMMVLDQIIMELYPDFDSLD